MSDMKFSESKVDAAIVCDSGVSGDEIISKMVSTGDWKLSDRVDYVDGRRVRYLIASDERKEAT